MRYLEMGSGFSSNAGAPPAPRLVARGAGAPHPLPYMQERFVRMYGELASPLFAHVRLIFNREGALDLTALDQCVCTLLRRHTALRTRFEQDNWGRWRAYIADSLDYEFRAIDVGQVNRDGRVAGAGDLLTSFVSTRFDLKSGPLVRVGAVTLDPSFHVLVLLFHHAVVDAWSMGIIWRELEALYSALSKGRRPVLPEAGLQFSDFAWYQKEWLDSEDARLAIAYWDRRVAGEQDPFWLPLDRRTPVNTPYNPKRASGSVSGVDVTALRNVAATHGTTLFTVVLAAFVALLFKWTHRSDVFTRVCHLGRPRTELYGTVGCFLSEWLLRAALIENSSFTVLLGIVKRAYVEAVSTSELPGIKMWDSLLPSINGRPFRVTSFNYMKSSFFEKRRRIPDELSAPRSQQLREQADVLVGSACLDGYLEPATELALVASVLEDSDSIAWKIQYDPHLFEEGTIESLSRSLAGILTRVAAGPDALISQLPSPIS